MNKILHFLVALLLISNISLAQSGSGEIYGKVTDEKGQPIDFAIVQAFEGGVQKGGAKTDLNGNFRIKPLSPGKYTLRVSYTGYNTEELQGIVLGVDKSLKIDVQLEKKTKTIAEVKIKEYKKKLIDASEPTKNSLTKEEIKALPTIRTSDMISTKAGTYQAKSGSGISIGGDRTSGTMFVIDGMMVRAGSINLPPGAIESIELLSNGVSAKYGNATGGIVGVTTIGIQRQFAGSLGFQHSVEGFNNNLLQFSVAGPLLTKRMENNVKRPVLGFTFSNSVEYNKDDDPYYFKYYKLKEEKLKSLQENPIIPNPNGTGNFIPATNEVTLDDFERTRKRENGQNLNTNSIFKLDYQPTEQIQVTLGSNFIYNNGRGYSFVNSLFSPEANQISQNYTSRNFLRFTQRLGKKLAQEKQDEKKSAIGRAFYSLQFTYQKSKGYGANPVHQKNPFDYQYIGKFNTHRSDYFQYDSAQGYYGLKFIGAFTDSVTFTPGGINPILENYTKAVYADDRFSGFSLNGLQALGGLRNGDGPSSVYSLWTGIGSQIGGYAYSDRDQVTVNLDASVDIEQGINNKRRKGEQINHNIQFGLGYDQSTSRSYSLSAGGLWNNMRLNTNRHILNYDIANPIYVIDGIEYTKEQLAAGQSPRAFSPFDTIRYNRLFEAVSQSRFDIELRKKLYNDDKNITFIDIDNLDRSMFNLDMFSADDLFNNGNQIVNYYGYDYLGNKLKKQPSFNDFWTKKDARGDYLRPVGAFRPIYMFGYILDKFSYKDLLFNIGLRIDRYDANQKSLKDPYSLYAVRKVSDIGNLDYKLAKDPNNSTSSATNPSTLPKDYVVYVDNNQTSKPTIVGYRNGDTWYDPFGKEIADPTILSGLYAGGLPIQPWLQNSNDSIKSQNFNPNSSFQDYKPEVSLSPRIQFTFPISEKSILYGNYDVITQTPSSSNFATPDDYYYLVERQSAIANANLKMERAINYSIGYTQRLADNAALTVEGFYRERKNQIQLQRYLLAYPITYTSVGNRDFSSTKGMIFKFDFRRLGPVKINVDYTLQFAEGTGSNTTSQASLLSTGQPNLRSVFPLDYDSRHVLNVILDYRYDDELKGPKIGKIYPFKNSGINFTVRTRSGAPYSRSNIAVPIVGGDFQSVPLVGTVNGSRLPWQVEVGTRINKYFTIKRKQPSGGEGVQAKYKRPFGLDIYSYISNLLNTKNTIGVYSYTGVGDDDGYLASPQGQQAVSNLQFQQSFSDLYQMRLASPGNFVNPRRIYIGFNFDF
ncbi:MAG: carboxypeptidase regulatory-like domain-containing protein [Chitinophagaceae bacterium]